MVYDMFIFYIPRIMPPKQRTRTAREAKLVRGSLDTILPIFGKNTAIWWEKAKQLNPGTRIWNWSGKTSHATKSLAGVCGAELGLGLRGHSPWQRVLRNLGKSGKLHDVYLIYRFIFIYIWCESLLIAATANIRTDTTLWSYPTQNRSICELQSCKVHFFECQHVTLELNPKEKRTGKTMAALCQGSRQDLGTAETVAISSPSSTGALGWQVVLLMVELGLVLYPAAPKEGDS